MKKIVMIIGLISVILFSCTQYDDSFTVKIWNFSDYTIKIFLDKEFMATIPPHITTNELTFKTYKYGKKIKITYIINELNLSNSLIASYEIPEYLNIVLINDSPIKIKTF